jgi:hypothetical protein
LIVGDHAHKSLLVIRGHSDACNKKGVVCHFSNSLDKTHMSFTYVSNFQ